jgi:hypothetical protein
VTEHACLHSVSCTSSEHNVMRRSESPFRTWDRSRHKVRINSHAACCCSHATVQVRFAVAVGVSRHGLALPWPCKTAADCQEATSFLSDCLMRPFWIPISVDKRAPTQSPRANRKWTNLPRVVVKYPIALREHSTQLAEFNLKFWITNSRLLLPDVSRQTAIVSVSLSG